MGVTEGRMGSKDPGPGRQGANGCSQEMSWKDRGRHPGIHLESVGSGAPSFVAGSEAS